VRTPHLSTGVPAPIVLAVSQPPRSTARAVSPVTRLGIAGSERTDSQLGGRERRASHSRDLDRLRSEFAIGRKA